MKTAMKRLFSLMLVAVLLVSAVPFQASAAVGDKISIIWYDEAGKELGKTEVTPKTGATSAKNMKDYAFMPDYDRYEWTIEQVVVEPGGHVKSKDEAIEAPATVHIYIAPVTPPSTPTACQTCGKIHDGECARCDDCHELVDDCTCNDPCNTCGKVHKGECDRCPDCHELVDACTCKDEHDTIHWEVKYKEGGDAEKSGSFTPNGETAKVSDILYYHVFKENNDWLDRYECTKVWSNKKQENVTYWGEVPEGDTISIVLTPKNQKPDGNKPGRPEGPGHKPESKYESITWEIKDEIGGEVRDSGTYSLKTSSIRAETLLSYASNHSHYWTKEFECIKIWSSEQQKEITTKDDIQEGDTVTFVLQPLKRLRDLWLYIYTNDNLKTPAKRVLLNDYKRIVSDGVVDKYEILSVIDDYYHAASSKKGIVWEGMYKTYASKHDDNLVFAERYNKLTSKLSGLNEDRKENVTIIKAHVTGIAKSSSSSSSGTADSSNPKTGDMIFMPAAILGVSASALAVLFYLNKKRAL